MRSVRDQSTAGKAVSFATHPTDTLDPSALHTQWLLEDSQERGTTIDDFSDGCYAPEVLLMWLLCLSQA